MNKLLACILKPTLTDHLDPDLGQTPKDEQVASAIGINLIHILGLKVKANGRVDTEWGDKTPCGLARTVYRILNGEHV